MKRLRGCALGTSGPNAVASSSPWSAVVNVVLIEGKDMMAMDFEGTSDPYVKFRYSIGAMGIIPCKSLVVGMEVIDVLLDILHTIFHL